MADHPSASDIATASDGDAPSPDDAPVPDYRALLRIGMVATAAALVLRPDWPVPRSSQDFHAPVGGFRELPPTMAHVVVAWAPQLRFVAAAVLAIPAGLVAFGVLRPLGLRLLLAAALWVLAPADLPGAVLVGVALSCHARVVLPGVAAGVSGLVFVAPLLGWAALEWVSQPAHVWVLWEAEWLVLGRYVGAVAATGWATARLGRAWLLAMPPELPPWRFDPVRLLVGVGVAVCVLAVVPVPFRLVALAAWLLVTQYPWGIASPDRTSIPSPIQI